MRKKLDFIALTQQMTGKHIDPNAPPLLVSEPLVASAAQRDALATKNKRKRKNTRPGSKILKPPLFFCKEFQELKQTCRIRIQTLQK